MTGYLLKLSNAKTDVDVQKLRPTWGENLEDTDSSLVKERLSFLSFRFCLAITEAEELSSVKAHPEVHPISCK